MLKRIVVMFEDGTNKVSYAKSVEVVLNNLTLSDVINGIVCIEEHNYELETIND